jgi:hypothetical protein
MLTYYVATESVRIQSGSLGRTTSLVWLAAESKPALYTRGARTTSSTHISPQALHVAVHCRELHGHKEVK